MTTFELTVAPGRRRWRITGTVDDLGDHRAAVDAVVAEHGAVLLRGLRLPGLDAAERAVRAVCTAPMAEYEPFAPRTEHRPGLYSATEWPPDQPMCMHHELSYARTVPSRQVFACLTAPEQGGAVALADGAAVLRGLPAGLVERFERHGWELLRSHNGAVGVDWRTAFATTDRAEVERYCKENGIGWTWGPQDTLRTTRLRPAVLRHPATGSGSGSTRSPSSTSGRWTRSSASTWPSNSARTGCRSPPAAGTAARWTRPPST